jgi:mono/diheme cytochrome c family protein
MRVLPALLAAALPAAPAAADDRKAFVETFCLGCHDAAAKKGGLDLSALPADPADPAGFARWVAVHDRVRAGEMPPKARTQPEPAERTAFTAALAATLTAADRDRAAAAGRATWRRLNRAEYENTLRDLLGLPWLRVKDILPEDGVAHGFNKAGEALDISHIQMARYLQAAEVALREATAQADRPASRTVRHYARDQRGLARKMVFSQFNRSPERATFPLVGADADAAVLDGKAEMSSPATRDREAVGVVAGAYEPIEPKFDNFRAPAAGRYKLRFDGYTFWAGPGPPPKWWVADRYHTSAGRTTEPVVISADSPPRLRRQLGRFDFTPEPGVRELDVYLLKGETIAYDAARLFRSRPPNFRNPLATPEGVPGVAFRWMEVEGPLADGPAIGPKLLFGDLGPKAAPADPLAEAERLLRTFVRAAYRRPVSPAEEVRFLPVVAGQLKAGAGFPDALFAGYAAVLCSPEFLCLPESPGRLADHALANRLSYFLWNSPPDAELRSLADRGALHDPAALRAQTERLLNDPKAERFVDAFTDYWLDLRKTDATAPDADLYPDYYLDDLLPDSAADEARLFVAELVRTNRPAKDLVAADWTFLNDRLAAHYGLPPVGGVALRKVPLPADSVRGGLLTMAGVLKVTANGTTTSPVLRGVWVMDRVLGQPLPPPPPDVPAVEPDTRGATTIREQLDKHRSVQTCAVCHTKIDPPGFALESFDVLGGYRTQYRALGDGGPPEKGYGKNGQPFAFHLAKPVDAAGTLPDGRAFKDVRELKRLLAADDRQLARNLFGRLVAYATGAAVRFGDRPRAEAALDRAAAGGYGVRDLVHEVVQSEMFLTK